MRKESIARVELFTDSHLAPDDWLLVIRFETAEYDDDGALVPGSQRLSSRRVEARFGDIKDDVIANGITVAQLAGLIQTKAYQMRAAAIAAEELQS